MKLYEEADAVPLCYSGEGCPIYDLVDDEELEERAQAYLEAKFLYQQTEDPETQKSTFQALGLYDDRETHVQLERIYSAWIAIKRAQNSAR